MQDKKVAAEFFRTAMGNEPVREQLKELGRPVKTQVGEDIKFVELNWRVDRPYVDLLRHGRGATEESIYEVRSTANDVEYRTLFFVYGKRMILTHFIVKKSRKTPLRDVELAWQRMKAWVGAERIFESVQRKGTRRP